MMILDAHRMWLATAARIPLASVAAQSLSFTTSAMAPLVVGAQVGTSLITDTRPPGPLPEPFVLQAVNSGPTDDAVTWLWLSTDAAGATVLMHGYAAAFGSASPIAANTNLIDVVLYVQATSPVMAGLSVDRTLIASSGSAVPFLRIDVGNDGSFEITETSPSWAGVANIALGQVTIPVRLLMQVSAAAGQQVSFATALHFVAENQLTISPVGGGCVPYYPFVVEPSFLDTGVRISRDTTHPTLFDDLVVAVLGTGTSPVVLPSSMPACLLVPNPQVTMFLPPGSSFQVPLPAAVRPLSFWAQGVGLLGSGMSIWNGDLFTTMTYRVDAY